MQVRIGRELTEEQLQPREYNLGDGRLMRAKLSSVPREAELSEILATWRYKGQPVLGSPLTIGLSGGLIKTDAELVGAVETLAFAGERDVELSPLKPPLPDLAVRQRGREAVLEVTQLPNRYFSAKLFELQDKLNDEMASNAAFAEILGDRRHSITFREFVPTKEQVKFVQRFVAWSLAQDWSGSDDIIINDPWLSQFAGAVTRRIVSFDLGATRFKAPLLRAGRLGNALPPQDDLAEIQRAIESKKGKTYSKGSVLWLAIATATSFNSVIAPMVHVDVDPGQFERIYISDAQDILLFEAV